MGFSKPEMSLSQTYTCLAFAHSFGLSKVGLTQKPQSLQPAFLQWLPQWHRFLMSVRLLKKLGLEHGNLSQSQ